MVRYTSGFRKLIAWQKAHELTLRIYAMTNSFPSSEQLGMTNQLRRAASSIEAQLAEGSRMRTMAHRKLYYNRAYASSAEVDTFMELALDLKYMKQEEYEKTLSLINEVSSLVYKLYCSCTR